MAVEAVIIREATDDDLPTLRRFAEQATAERGYGDLFGPVEWDALTLTEQSAAVVAELADQVIGCFIVALVAHGLTGRPYGEQILWYVEHAHRRTSIGLRLLDAIEALCLTRAATLVTVKQPADRPRWSAHLRRRGYRAIEVSHAKDLSASLIG